LTAQFKNIIIFYQNANNRFGATGCSLPFDCISERKREPVI